jgi:GPH family glycoside/pentoside/hexuronide:cation symporter
MAKASARPFGTRDKVGYLFGDLANDFTFLFASSFLQKFYTDVLGVTPFLVAALFVTARCVDAFTDVGMGRLVDTTALGPEGRFRPWLRRMAVPLLVSSVAMYLYPVANLPYGVRVAYMFITYILWGSFCYTAANIPYGSMASVISTDPGDRTSLSTYRSVGAMLASIPVTVLSPLLLFREENGVQTVIPQRYFLLAVIYGILAMVCYYVCYAMTTERVQLPPKKKEQEAGFFDLVKTLLRNRALLAIIGAALSMLVAQLLSQGMSVYLFTDYFGSAALLSLTNLASFVPMIILAPMARRLSERYGKKECSIVGVAIAVAGFGALFVLHTAQPGVYIALMLVASVGMGFFNMVIWAFITDIIDYQEVRTGSRDDGTVYAIYSFSRKLGQALAGGISGVALGLIGYVTATGGQAVVQSQSTLDGIYNVCTGGPAIAYLVVLLLLIFVYPLNKRTVEENVAILQARRGKEAA